LALHQVYCLSLLSSSPEKSVTAPGFSLDNGSWLEVIQQLLLLIENNKSPSERYINHFAQFPCPLDRLVQNDDYQTVLQQVGHILSLISENWTRFEHEILLRRYPPLIEELIAQFDISSPIFQSVIVKAFVRRLYGSDNKILLQECKDGFEWNREIHELSTNPAVQELGQKEKETYVDRRIYENG
jgi:hypothetical protein